MTDCPACTEKDRMITLLAQQLDRAQNSRDSLTGIVAGLAERAVPVRTAPVERPAVEGAFRAPSNRPGRLRSTREDHMPTATREAFEQPATDAPPVSEFLESTFVAQEP